MVTYHMLIKKIKTRVEYSTININYICWYIKNNLNMKCVNMLILVFVLLGLSLQSNDIRNQIFRIVKG